MSAKAKLADRVTLPPANPAWVCQPCDGRGQLDGKVCAWCDGKGYIEVIPCESCGGSGHLVRTAKGTTPLRAPRRGG